MSRVYSDSEPMVELTIRCRVPRRLYDAIGDDLDALLGRLVWLNGHEAFNPHFEAVPVAPPAFCRHVWIQRPNGMTQVFYNGTNAYTQCEKCGKKEKV